MFEEELIWSVVILLLSSTFLWFHPYSSWTFPVFYNSAEAEDTTDNVEVEVKETPLRPRPPVLHTNDDYNIHKYDAAFEKLPRTWDQYPELKADMVRIFQTKWLELHKKQSWTVLSKTPDSPTTMAVPPDPFEAPPLNTEELFTEAWNFTQQEIDKQQKQRLQSCIMNEMVPRGNVWMHFDSDRDAFVYFCNTSIPIGILNAMAKRYAVLFHCRPLVICEQEEKERVQKLVREQQQKKKAFLEQQQQKFQQQSKQVLAQFKKYNKPTLHAKQDLTAANYGIEAKNNHFVQLGNLYDFAMLRKEDQEARRHLHPAQKMSYRQFKEACNRKPGFASLLFAAPQTKSTSSHVHLVNGTLVSCSEIHLFKKI